MSKEVNKVYRSIESAKKRLIGKAKKEGCLWENFGQNEVEKLKAKFGWDYRISTDDNMEIQSAIHEFSDWCGNVSYAMIA